MGCRIDRKGCQRRVEVLEENRQLRQRVTCLVRPVEGWLEVTGRVLDEWSMKENHQ